MSQKASTAGPSTSCSASDRDFERDIMSRMTALREPVECNTAHRPVQTPPYANNFTRHDSNALSNFQADGRADFFTVSRQMGFRNLPSVIDGQQDIIHQIIAEEIIFSRRMHYVARTVFPSFASAHPPIAPQDRLSDLTCRIFYCIRQIADRHDQLVQLYRSIQTAEFPCVLPESLLDALSEALLDLQQVYLSFLAHNIFARSTLEAELAMNSNLQRHLTNLYRQQLADGQDLLTLLAAPGLHLHSLSEHLRILLDSSLCEGVTEQLLLQISIINTLCEAEKEPRAAEPEELELDCLAAEGFTNSFVPDYWATQSAENKDYWATQSAENKVEKAVELSSDEIREIGIDTELLVSPDATIQDMGRGETMQEVDGTGDGVSFVDHREDEMDVDTVGNDATSQDMERGRTVQEIDVKGVADVQSSPHDEDQWEMVEDEPDLVLL